MKIKKGDKVQVITGAYKDTVGEVLACFPKENRIIVEGVNVVKKHMKPTQQNPDGGIVEKEAKIHVSNVMIYDEKAKKAGRVGFKFETDKKGNTEKVRVNKKTGFAYKYSEGSMAFPDALDRPSRTILTGEGGRGASRFKHVIETEDGRYRRLVPDELDQLQGFPRGWTDTGMTDGQRAFCMGNALVVGIPHAVGKVIAEFEGKRHV